MFNVAEKLYIADPYLWQCMCCTKIKPPQISSQSAKMDISCRSNPLEKSHSLPERVLYGPLPDVQGREQSTSWANQPKFAQFVCYFGIFHIWALHENSRDIFCVQECEDQEKASIKNDARLTRIVFSSQCSFCQLLLLNWMVKFKQGLATWPQHWLCPSRLNALDGKIFNILDKCITRQCICGFI